MELATRDYIINTIFRTNILPVISECNTSCVFCSHKQNPGRIEVFRMPRLTLSDFDELTGFLSPHKKIVIGESATRIVEGEPLLHPDFMEVLTLIRRKFANTPIQVTTNGILLDHQTVAKLLELGNIEMNISVNGANSTVRRKLLGHTQEENIREKIEMLAGRIKYSGSCVFVPELMNWNDVEDIIALLDSNGAEAMRLFLPGYTSKNANSLDFMKIHNEAQTFVSKVRQTYRLPIIVEPAVITDLNSRIEGIIKGTPADAAGLAVGDIIVGVNAQETRTRVDSFNKAYRAPNPVITVQRGSERVDIKLIKPKNSSPGFIVLYDADPELAKLAESVATRHKAQNVLFVTSELAFAIIDNLLKQENFGFKYHVIAAKNYFFGGTIKCAGLLTAEDIVSAVEEYMETGPKPDLAILPPIMFDFRKRDLKGTGIKEIESRLGISVDTV